jgi:hypothetical protein
MLALLAMLVGVLNFSAGDTGLPYSILPTAAELSGLGARLAHDLRVTGTPTKHIAVTCEDATCARRAGMSHHLARVIFSSATRHMAMIWTAEASVVDVASGRVTGPYDIGYKGDYDAISAGLDQLATAMVPAVNKPTAVAHVKQ